MKYFNGSSSRFKNKKYDSDFYRTLVEKNKSLYKTKINMINHPHMLSKSKIKSTNPNPESFLTIYNKRYSQEPETQKEERKKFILTDKSKKRRLYISSTNNLSTGLPVLQIVNINNLPLNIKIENDQSHNNKIITTTKKNNIFFHPSKTNNPSFTIKPKQNIITHITQLNRFKEPKIQKIQIVSKQKDQKEKIYKLNSFEHFSLPGSKNNITKINQDSLFILNNLFDNKNYNIFGVLDGHGEEGEIISKEVSNFLSSYYLSQIQNNSNFYSYLTNSNYKSIYDLFSSANENLKSKKLNTENSGTTVNIVHIINNKLICVNLGDSRAIGIREDNSIIHFSRDHKPNVKGERERIEKAGGEVARVNWANFGPYRVWFKGEDEPGLAMSRSLGDDLAKRIGVIEIPEIKEFDINEEKLNVCIIATDGIWEFVSSEKARDIVMPYYESDDCKGAVRRLAKEGRRMWELNNKMGIDDITVIVLFF